MFMYTNNFLAAATINMNELITHCINVYLSLNEMMKFAWQEVYSFY